MDPNQMLRMRRCGIDRWSRSTAWVVALILCGALLTTTTPLAAQTPTPAANNQAESYYTVRRGESWSLIANRFGVSVRALQEANPDLIRYNDVLKVGDKLVIPGVTQPTPAPTTAPTTVERSTSAPTAAAASQEYVVKPGEGWSIIAERFGVSLRDLLDANPDLIRGDYVLYTGDQLRIPGRGGAQPAAAAPAAATAAPTVPPSPTPQPSPTATATASAAAPTASTNAALITATGEITSTEAVTTGAPSAAAASGCPDSLVDFPAQITSVLQAAAADPDGGVATLNAFLEGCQAAVPDGIQSGDWTGDGIPDLIVLYADPKRTSEAPVARGDLMIFVGVPNGYTEGYRARAAGEVSLFALADINRDGQPDISWIDRTCGASTCFDTVEVVSWDGNRWRDWTQEAITMAYANVKLEDTTPVGQGDEIVLTGGDYGSVGAGPQRQRTETWGSIDGAAYTLLERVFAPSNCLYHTVLDANDALSKDTAEGLTEAEALYTKAATDQTLEKCWTRENELDELRSFSLFRLALTAAYKGKPEVAVDLIDSLSTTYPDSVYNGVGQAWLAAYQQDKDAGAACRATSTYAEEHPATYEILADYGYANPTFVAGDVCPVLEPAPLSLGAAAAVTGTAPLSATGAVSPALAAGGLPLCPADLNGYGTALPALLDSAKGDNLIIETWLRQCDAMNDDRGGYLLKDLNDDGVEDAILWPTVVSELGFGPNGAQGDLLIYHGLADGGYKLAVDEEIYGQPALLAAKDLNNDGTTDIAWQVVGCSTFCVLEAQVVSWNGDEYTSIIQPGATIAEGSAHFEPVAAGDPGAGQQLVLEGGMSGTADGGLAVPHTESWQSVNGAAFQRIRWSYDRTVEGNDCMGLRLVEADVALQAAPVLGYEPAITLYKAAIDPTLKACSIYGMSGEEEIKLLQGLASFRLIQAQALAGDAAAAQTTLAALSKGQPESDYTKAASEWLAAYQGSQDAGSACEAVASIFADNALLWQITDHYGYNHPALAAEQICYVP